MNTIARKLVLSVLTVVLTVIALGTTTFAWFTLTNTSVIQPFDAQVVADTGIEVAIGASNADPLTLEWQTVITTQDIYDYMESVYGVDGFRFNHVSTTDGRNFTDLEGVGTTDGYLEIPLHFRSDNEQQINWTQVGLSSLASGWQTGVQFVDSQGVTRLANSTFSVNLMDAMKVSVTGIVDRALMTTGTTAFENPASATNTLSGGLSSADLSNGGVGDDGALNYYYEVTNTLPTGTASVSTVATVTSISNTLVLDMASGQSATADAEYYGNIVVRVWFEGWDAEAYNSLLGRIISISLRFAA